MMIKTTEELVAATIAKLGKKGETIWLFDSHKRLCIEFATDDPRITPELVHESVKSYMDYRQNGGIVKLKPLLRETPKVSWNSSYPALIRLVKVQNETKVKTLLHLN